MFPIKAFLKGGGIRAASNSLPLFGDYRTGEGKERERKKKNPEGSKGRRLPRSRMPLPQ